MAANEQVTANHSFVFFRIETLLSGGGSTFDPSLMFKKMTREDPQKVDSCSGPILHESLDVGPNSM